MNCSLQKIVLKVLRFCFYLRIRANISTVIVALSEMKLLLIFWLLVLLTWLWAGLHMVYQLLWLLVMFCIFNTSLVCITKNSACLCFTVPFSALTLLVGQQEGRLSK